MNPLHTDSPWGSFWTSMQWLTESNSADGFKAFNTLDQVISEELKNSRHPEWLQSMKRIQPLVPQLLTHRELTPKHGTVITGEEATLKSSDYSASKTWSREIMMASNRKPFHKTSICFSKKKKLKREGKSTK